MDITRDALKHINHLKSRQDLPAGTGLRLGLKDGHVYLKWEQSGPREDDLVVMKRGLPIYIDAQAYFRMADYLLDFKDDNGMRRFILRPRTRDGAGEAMRT